MTWRGPRTASDPIYATPQHKANRKYWINRRAPCAYCGWPIDYTANGRYSKLSFHLDHIMPIATGRAQGWTTAMLNALTNTRPLHRKCNIRHGARLGQQRQRVKAKRRKVLNTSRQW
jgi:5-methylcytosine-specific restriction endonuclease McrA